MKNTIIEGVSDNRIERLKKHMLKVEHLAGKPLREKRRPHVTWPFCPIEYFAPNKDDKGLYFGAVGFCHIRYGDYEDDTCRIHEDVWAEGDTRWWRQLKPDKRKAILNYISQWIKDGKKL